MLDATKIVLLLGLVLLGLAGLKELKSIGTQLDAIHLELRTANGSLDGIESCCPQDLGGGARKP